MPLKYKILTIVIALLFLMVFNPFGGQTKSKEQIDFDNWLSVSTTAQATPQPQEKPQDIFISLQSTNPEHPFKWELKSTDSADMTAKVQRLLRQAREASLFELDRKRDAGLRLEIVEGEKKFIARFDESDIESNVKASLFVRLFEEYVASTRGLQKKKGA